MKPFRHLLLLFGGLAFILFTWLSCAQVGSPSGGPRDTIPPEVIRTEPPNYSTQFDAQTVLIAFNEYYQIKNRQNAVMVSPPMAESPKVVEKGQTIAINLQDTLRSNTTYTFDFGNNIQDLNEGNPLGAFQYVVSTGKQVDSLRISGYVVDAFTYAPREEVEVYLYRRDIDSLPKTSLPLYWAKTDEKGNFSINNIREGSYKVFALEDANRNHKYDVQSENIAFLDTLVTPRIAENAGADTLQPDSVDAGRAYAFRPDNIHLRMFKENNQKQYLKSSRRIIPGKCLFVFNKVIDSLQIRPANFSDTSGWAMQENTLPQDSLIYWLRDTSIMYTDSLGFNLRYTSRDSLGNSITVDEEVHLVYDTATTSPPTQLSLSSNARNKDRISPRNPVYLETGTPVRKVDTALIRLYRVQDSIEIAANFSITPDTMKLRRHHLQAGYMADSLYKVEILPGAFTGWYGNTNDTTVFTFSYVPEDAYGDLQMVINNLESPAVFEILRKGKVTRRNYIMQDTTVRMPYLQPGEYQFRLIADENSNERWDTGNYDKGRQPEFVHYFKEVVTIKPGWDNKLQWNLKRSVSKREKEK